MLQVELGNHGFDTPVVAQLILVIDKLLEHDHKPIFVITKQSKAFSIQPIRKDSTKPLLV